LAQRMEPEEQPTVLDPTQEAPRLQSALASAQHCQQGVQWGGTTAALAQQSVAPSTPPLIL